MTPSDHKAQQVADELALIKAKRRRRILERKHMNMFNKFPGACRDSTPIKELFNP